MEEQNPALVLLLPAISKLALYFLMDSKKKRGGAGGLYFSSKEELLEFCASSSMRSYKELTQIWKKN